MNAQSASRPLIAIPAYPIRAGRIDGWIDAGHAVPDLYLRALHRAGGLEAIISAVENVDAAALLDRFDGLLLLGGGDVDPATYGQERRETIYGVSTLRDAFECALAREAVRRGMPTLAICRGIQVLNVALGGTLDQHITDRSGLLAHGVPGVEGGATMHAVEVEAGSRLAAALGATEVECSSHHHQVLDRVAEGMPVVARAADGVIEGVEADGDAWIVAVQWHPEDTAGDDPSQQSLFDTFIDASRDAL